MALRLAYNTTDSAVLADEQGHLIGGRQWGTVDTTDPVSKGELASGRLVEVDEDGVADSGNPDAVAAVEALRARRDATDEARGLSKDELIEQLDPEVVESLPKGADGKPAKDDLVDAAASDEAKKSTTKQPRSGRK